MDRHLDSDRPQDLEDIEVEWTGILTVIGHKIWKTKVVEWTGILTVTGRKIWKTKEWNTVACRNFTNKRQPQARSEVLHHLTNQLPQHGHALSYPQATQDHDRGTAGRRTSRF